MHHCEIGSHQWRLVAKCKPKAFRGIVGERQLSLLLAPNGRHTMIEELQNALQLHSDGVMRSGAARTMALELILTMCPTDGEWPRDYI